MQGYNYSADEKLAIMEQVCACLASQDKSLKRICADPGNDIPVESTRIWAWMNQDDRQDEMLRLGLREMYEKAREAQVHVSADAVKDIADDGANDYYERAGKDGEVKVVFDKENVQRSRLRVDARRWLATVLLPRTFGNKLEVDAKHSGSIDLVARLDQARQEAARLRQDKGRILEGSRVGGIPAAESRLTDQSVVEKLVDI